MYHKMKIVIAFSKPRDWRIRLYKDGELIIVASLGGTEDKIRELLKVIIRAYAPMANPYSLIKKALNSGEVTFLSTIKD